MSEQQTNGWSQKWGNAISTGMLLLFMGGAFWALAYQPIQRGQDRFEARLDRVEAAMQRSEEQDAKRFVLKENSAEYRGRVDDAIKRNQTDLLQLRTDVVPRGEHQEKWKSNDAAILNLEKKIEDIRKDIGAAYSLGDKIKELQRQIETLTTKKID